MTAVESWPSSPLKNRAVSLSKTELLAKAAVARAHGHQWKQSYRARVLLVDTIAVSLAVSIATVGRFGLPMYKAPSGDAWLTVAGYSFAIAVIWLFSLGAEQSRDLSLVGVGAEEYRRVWLATAWLFGIVAAAALVLNEELSRGYLLIVFPVGLAALMTGRHLLRRNLARQRAGGDYMNHVLVLGSVESVGALCKSFHRSTSAGYEVIGACVPDFDGVAGEVVRTDCGEIPVFGDEFCVEEALRLTCADAVAVAAAERLGHQRMRELAWRLDPLGVDMIVLPAMTDVAVPRLKVRPIDNLPLFHIERPRYDARYSRYAKRTFDFVFAAAALVALTPLMIATALVIKCDRGGPVIFRQWRVGRGGKPFRIMKFRTMHVGAEAAVPNRSCNDQGADIVFLPKAPIDTRVTRVGALLRKTSIDELPQLMNVLAGSMSIVGPRPLAVGEGANVEHYLERRCLMKPGITGLWQISGRSDSTAEERIRLDHSYIDNWSWVQDMIIVLRTVRAVLRRDGAY